MDRLSQILEDGEVTGVPRNDSITATRITFLLPYKKGLMEELSAMMFGDVLPSEVRITFVGEDKVGERVVKKEHQDEAKKLRAERNKALTQANKLREKFEEDILALGITNTEDVSLNFCDKRYEIPEDWYNESTIRLSVSVPYLSEIRKKYVTTTEE
jgi:hypothetical protein